MDALSLPYVDRNQNLKDLKDHRHMNRQEMEHLRENAEIAREVIGAHRYELGRSHAEEGPRLLHEFVLRREEDVRLPGKGTSHVHSARPVHPIITIIQWIQASGSAIRNRLSRSAQGGRHKPQKALDGGIPGSFLEPLGRSWSHFVGIYRQKLTRSLEN